MQRHWAIVTRGQIKVGLLLIEFVKDFEERRAYIFRQAFAGNHLVQLRRQLRLSSNIQDTNRAPARLDIFVLLDYVQDRLRFIRSG